MASDLDIKAELILVYYTFKFQIITNWKKFFAFALISVAIFFLLGPFQYELFRDYQLPENILAFYRDGINFVSLIILFATCFFFGGIICVEYDKETGFIVFPKINRFKLISGKYLAYLTLIFGVVAIYYGMLMLFGYYYYRGPVAPQIFLSFGFALMYALALSGFVTLFSSFMKSVNFTIVATILIFLIGFQISEQIVVLFNPEIEPLFSLNYMSNLISSTLQQDFPDTRAERYTEFNFENFSFRNWNTPSMEAGLIIMSVYTILQIIAAALIFNRRQL